MATSEKASELIKYCRQGGRICPQPNNWNDLWNLLPNKVNGPQGWQPSLPLILAAWWEATDLMKMLRLEEHIIRADELGGIAVVDEFLRSLEEEDWYKG
jgi:hypothetical protein